MLAKTLALTFCLGAVGGAALADPKFEYGKAAEVEKVKGTEYNASAEAGIVFTTGNSETITATAGIKAARKTGLNKIAFDGTLTYAKSAVRVLEDNNGNGLVDNDSEITSVETTTANTLAAKLRYDRFLTKYNSLFIAALAARDVPAGKDLVLGAQAGYSRQLFKSKTAEAVAELGYDYSHEDLVTGPSNSIHSLRAFLGYKAEMTEGTTFETSLEGLTNLNEEEHATRMGEPATIGEDTRLNFKASVSSKIGKNLSFQTSLEVKYDQRPGPLGIKNLAPGFVPEASKMDTIMKASLIYTIF
ncbi:MAG: DUF481 domain-containing protein [Deltaproteobacteria bacterium]|nr:DUF481 domain-containing protein [Deltaproteobacteria bacterium]